VRGSLGAGPCLESKVGIGYVQRRSRCGVYTPAVPVSRSRAFLRFLARWDRDEQALRDAFSEAAGHPIEFAGIAPPKQAGALFGLFERNPLDALTQRADDTWVLPWHPWAAWRTVVEERYLTPKRAPLHARIPLPYHRVPGKLRLALYPLVAGRTDLDPEASPPDPAWPIERRLDRMRMELYRELTDEGARTGSFEPLDPGEVPRGPWPGGRRYPLVMTHDVDTKEGMALAGTVLDEMVELGLKPCFFLVGLGYKWDHGFCEAVRQAGGEIGLHGDTHDNRISYVSAEEAGRRLDRCQRQIRRWDIRGFRSPSLLVSDALYEAVGTRFAWDSSVPDTDTHTLIGPRRGCGTTFPFRRGETLVLPTTMPADDRLLLLGYDGLDALSILRRKWKHVQNLGGMAHFLTHPEPHLFGKPVMRDLFRALIREMLDEGDAWVATPSEVAEFWRSLEDGGAPDPSDA